MAVDKKAQINDPLLDRLERLSARQGRVHRARTLPPPDPGLAPTLPTSPPYARGLPIVAPRTPPQAGTRTRRRHPSRGARIVSLLASCATTSGLAYFFAGTETSQASSSLPGLVAPIATTSPSSIAASTPPTTIGSATTIAAPATAAAPPTAAAPAATAAPATPAAAAASAVAAFEGDTIQTRYGPVQVQAQITNGKLVAIAVMQYPDGDGRSVRINRRALPQLQSETLTAQSAHVDTVSGATYTSDGYVRSLQSAIDEALASGAMTA